MAMIDLPEADDEQLRTFCLHVVRYMSTVAMDPHLYFQQKMSAQIAGSAGGELRQSCSQLIDWVDSIGLTEDQLRRLDESLAAARLPLFSAITRRD